MPKVPGEPELTLPAGLDSPAAIQALLDEIPYSPDPIYRCPLSVLRDRKAHCFDGAVLAAAALRQIGFPPLLVEILSVRDDGHLLAVFKIDGRWGAVAQSNFVGLRYREPVYASLRELVMSYFESHYNVAREKTMRGYTVPLSLRAFDRQHWTTRDETMDLIAARLDQLRRVFVLTPAMVERLLPVDPRSFEAGMLGVVQEGLYRPD